MRLERKTVDVALKDRTENHPTSKSEGDGQQSNKSEGSKAFEPQGNLGVWKRAEPNHAYPNKTENLSSITGTENRMGASRASMTTIAMTW